ncbi:hypothetical protein CcaverHIS002_0502160 [Cutaneotrichosporon cavernicola]|uniref:CFEM domain-containing protein n=1 Tax=Cutaneotrichosporon cavernicola TaxID=279322 RepID=A0AA48L5Z7_9TREE|nr:uncharacterized protein CcaverHIS019_0502740 [Cutaneotrichosporon cavernicola]BEI84815.1 hypothetical protein CcaverHIS002_0502160 [Cutaneotrichosporon cavernicola]BEI92646.1 hypothetical protein CcaverHIS019_0502740 [Cutaneotrichosporon cavernicola]BEJ00421.1 hypothetical protein CcaverHIS631_0502780 [Cutaneotrichosporon cavernicola]BEJ08190.1 hypothetical protein CcaverHIS641_0502750 [Cutaneotrichosporon cavernicola]
MMKPKYFAAAVVLAAGSAAHTLSPCILTCMTTGAAAAGCSGITDLSCVCRPGSFFDSAQECLKSQCPDDITANATVNSLCDALLGGLDSNSPPSSSNSASGTSATVTAARTGPAAPNTEGGAIEEPFVVDATEDVVTPYKMEIGESTLSKKGYGSLVTYEPQDPPGDEPSPTTYPTSSQDRSTMKQELQTQQNIVTIDPNEPMHEDTARALLAALHRQQGSVGVNQEQDAGPVGTAIPPSYNPGWAQRQSESSGLGIASPSSGMSHSASPPKPLSS